MEEERRKTNDQETENEGRTRKNRTQTQTKRFHARFWRELWVGPIDEYATRRKQKEKKAKGTRRSVFIASCKKTPKTTLTSSFHVGFSREFLLTPVEQKAPKSQITFLGDRRRRRRRRRSEWRGGRRESWRRSSRRRRCGRRGGRSRRRWSWNRQGRGWEGRRNGGR